MAVTTLAYNGRFRLTLGEPLKACLGKPFVALPARDKYHHSSQMSFCYSFKVNYSRHVPTN